MNETADLMKRYRRTAMSALPGRVAKMVLYGSRARGDAVADSDWDVAVFLDGERPVFEDRRALADAAYDLIVESGAFIHPIVFPISRWREDSRLMRDIRRHGIEI